MVSVRKLHYCASPGSFDTPLGATLHRTAYAAAREFLKQHPDFEMDQGSYFGKQVFIGRNTEKLYSVVIGMIDVPAGTVEPKTLTADHVKQQLVYRDLSYDDFVSGLPVLSVRADNHARIIPVVAD